MLDIVAVIAVDLEFESFLGVANLTDLIIVIDKISRKYCKLSQDFQLTVIQIAVICTYPSFLRSAGNEGSGGRSLLCQTYILTLDGLSICNELM